MYCRYCISILISRFWESSVTIFLWSLFLSQAIILHCSCQKFISLLTFVISNFHIILVYNIIYGICRSVCLLTLKYLHTIATGHVGCKIFVQHDFSASQLSLRQLGPRWAWKMTLMKDSQEVQLECAHLLYKEWQLCWQQARNRQLECEHLLYVYKCWQMCIEGGRDSASWLMFGDFH